MCVPGCGQDLRRAACLPLLPWRHRGYAVVYSTCFLRRNPTTNAPYRFIGGLFPGIVLYMSSFYKRHEMQVRFAMMFSATSLAGAFSGLLAAGIQHMDGLRGLPGWAWIFILVCLTLDFSPLTSPTTSIGRCLHLTLWPFDVVHHTSWPSQRPHPHGVSARSVRQVARRGLERRCGRGRSGARKFQLERSRQRVRRRATRHAHLLASVPLRRHGQLRPVFI
jgi:MFS family permease